VADLGFFSNGDDFGKPTRTEGIWAYGIILCICELGHAGADTGGD